MKIDVSKYNVRDGSIASEVIELAARRPTKGFTSGEAYDSRSITTTDYQSLKGRISELKTKGVLVATGATRKDAVSGAPQEVLRLNQYYTTF